MVTRVAVSWINGAPHLLVSDLSPHTKALTEHPACSLLLGELGTKGDPLNHPRLTLQCKSEQADKSNLRETWLTIHPKAKLYYDFTDFRLLRLQVHAAYLSGGFGKAFHLNADDLK